MNFIEKDISLLIPIAAGTLLFSVLVAFIIYFIFLYRKTQQKFDWERQRFKQALLQTEIEIREQTLLEVSRELHDNLGQVASLIKINLNMLSANLLEADREKITASIELTRQMVGDIKHLSVDLKNRNSREINLLQAIGKDVARINRAGIIKVEFQSDPSIPAMPVGTETILYRLIQEILNNMLQHSEADEAKIEIKSGLYNLIINYSDNGKGFDKNLLVLDNRKGMGLVNLRERCSLLGADLKIDTQLQKGTKIQIVLPFK